ncbi:MAG: sulfotransferase family 2 domain-containing protein [Steroidobacteraceae bacterium]
MLISVTHGFLFVHVQKTAGTSLTRLLEPHSLRPSGSRLNKLGSDLLLVRDWRRHYFRIHAPLVRAERLIPPEEYARLVKFAFVRNPWDRLVSWYAYLLKDTTHRRHRQVAAGSFEDFARAELRRDDRSQWWMIANQAGELGLDFVGRFENLEQDVAEVCRRLGLPVAPLPRENVSTRRPYQEYYSRELAVLVGVRWAREVEAFGYRFD